MKNYLCRIMSLALILAHVAGCTGSLPPPPSEKQRSQLGKVAVVSIYETPLVGLGQGAIRGAGKIFGEEEPIVGREMAAAREAAAWILPLFDPIGGFGANFSVYAIPTDTAEQFDQQIRKAAIEAKPHAELLRRVIALIQREKISAVTGSSVSGPKRWRQNPDYGDLLEKGIDTVLEVGVLKIGLIGHASRGGADPWLSVVMQAGVRLVNIKKNTELYSRKNLSTTSQPRRFSEWRSDEVALFHKGLDGMFADTAKKIVEHVFLLVR